MRNVFIFVLIIITISSCQSSGYTIIGKIKGINANQLYLCKLENDSQQLMYIDSSTVKKESFTFHGKTVEDVEEFLLVWDNVRVPFFLENGRIKIHGDVHTKEYTITGTPNNDAWSTYNKQKVKDDKAFIMSHKNLQVAAYLAEKKSKAYSFEKNDYLYGPKELDSLTTIFDSSIQHSHYVRLIKERAIKMKSIQIGSIAPDFTLPTPDGQFIQSSSFRGKWVLINFWASWCAPCREEMPHLSTIYQKYKNKGLEILSISTDKEKEAWLKALKELRMNWPQCMDEKRETAPQTADLYLVEYIPWTLLLDKEGRIIAKELYGDKLEEKLKEVVLDN